MASACGWSLPGFQTPVLLQHWLQATKSTQTPVNAGQKRALASAFSDTERAGSRGFHSASTLHPLVIMFLLANMAIYLAAFDVEKRDSAMTCPPSELIPEIQADFRANITSHTAWRAEGGTFRAPAPFIGGASLEHPPAVCLLSVLLKASVNHSASHLPHFLVQRVENRNVCVLRHHRKLSTSSKSNHKPKHPDGARGSRGSEPGS